MVAVVTDSASNIPVALARAHGIEVAPLHLSVGEEEFRDGVDLTPADFYARLVTDRARASTAAPSPGDFLDAFQRSGEGEIVCALVYNPILDELYTAEKGQGAFVNSRRLRVAARKSLTDCVISTGTPHRGRGDHQKFLSECKALMEQVSGIRRTGSAAIDLAWVAAGRFDGYVEHNLQAWDMAAGILLVREAGGFATDVDGRQRMFDTGSIVAGNQVVHRALLEVLADAGRESAAAERPAEG